jgi:thiol-disulfide isomerase/thioredoxin
MTQNQGSNASGRWRQAARFTLQTMRWAAIIYLAFMAVLLGWKPLQLILGSGESHFEVANGDLTIMSEAGRGSLHLFPILAVAALALTIVGGTSWLLQKTSRRERLVHTGAILGLVVVMAGLYLGLRTEAAQQLGKLMPVLDVDYLTPRPELAGKVVLVEFWATWCGPCIANIPHLNELQEKFRDRGLVVVGISSEKDRETVEKYWQKRAMHYAVALQPSGELQNKLGVRGIPHSFLVSRTGQIIWEGHPASLTTDYIEEVLR